MELLRRLSLTIFLIALTACGGGSLESDNDDGDITEPPVVETTTLSLSISDTRVTGAQPVVITAVVMTDGVAAEGEVVTFQTDLGALSPSSGTARTDASGEAAITLTAGNVRGAGTVNASLASGAVATITFETQGDDIGVVGDINITLTLLDPVDEVTDTITSSKPGKVIATVNGVSSPVIVTFITTVGEIPVNTAITNDENEASVDIFAGDSLGAGTITASIVSGETGQVLLVVGSSSVKMGSGDPFVENVAEISLEQISAGGTTVISVSIIDDQGNLFTEPVDVNFASSCVTRDSAIISSPISTSNGIANSTYLAKGCVGDDPISVTANAGGINLTASTLVNVLPASIGSIEFVSALPESIGILGAGALGGSESSIVQFRVLDTNSNPVNNQLVEFTLNTDVGGIQLIPSTATTNSEGIVQTVVNSGTVATSVRVKALINVEGQDIASQSSLLVVSTGIPDQDSISLSASVLNPEGWDIDGTEVEVTARLADAFNNPVPDGTAVSFTTEGGRIEDSCITVGGTCSVIWNSQNARPQGHVLIHTSADENTLDGNGDVIHLPEIHNSLGQKYGGRSTVLATAIGEESFPDLNGNGRFDAAEMTAFAGTDVSGEVYDLKEAFVDHNEDGYYNPDPTEAALAGADPKGSGTIEEFADFNVDNLFTQNDGKYNGILCSIPAHDGCSTTQKSINVRDSLTLVMSGSDAFFTIESTVDAVGGFVLVDDDNDPITPDVIEINSEFDPSDDVVYIDGENIGAASVIIADLHNQPMPAGTIISFEATVGSVVGDSSFLWPNDNHNGGRSWGVSIRGEDEPKSGSLLVTATTPSGVATLFGTIGIVIN